MKMTEKYYKEVIALKRWAAGGNRYIDNFIDETLDPEEEQIIILKYKYKKNWLRISFDVHISERQLYRKHNKILEKLNLWKKVNENIGGGQYDKNNMFIGTG